MKTVGKTLRGRKTPGKILASVSGTCVVFALLCVSSAVRAQTCWESPVSVHWNEVPLRDALSRLAEVRRFGFLLDRRIDPGTPVFLEARDEPLGTVLRRLVETTTLPGTSLVSGTTALVGNGDSGRSDVRLGVCFLGENVYLGPRETTNRLPGLLDELRRQADVLPSRQARRLLRESTLRIPMLSDPRRVLEQAAKEAGFSWTELDTALPHDLWDRTELVDLPLYRQLALVLAGFDRAPDFSEARSGRLGTIPFAEIPVTMSPAATVPLAAVPVADAVSGGKSSKNPETSPGNPLAATAVSGHNSLETQDNGTRDNGKRSPVPLNRMRFTMTIRNQELRPLLGILAERAALELEIDETALEKRGVSLDTRVSFEVKDATAAELFRAATRPVGANFRIRGTTLVIR